jgi:hypothetical protein
MAIAVIDGLSDSGAVSDSDVKEYKFRAPYLLDAWQHEIAKSGDFFKTIEFSCFRKNNLLGDLNCFQAIEFIGVDQIYTAIGANCFYVEVNENSIIKLQENGQPLSGTYIFNGGTPTAFNGTINITVPAGTTSYLPIRGVLSPSSQTSATSLIMSGTTYYRHNNRALSPYKYSSASKVPDFKPWYKIDMPSDFKSRTQVIDEYPSFQYEIDSQFKWENNNELYVQFGYEGLIRIDYIPVPTKITDLSQTLEVDDTTAMSGAYYLAKMFALADQNTELANVCSAKYKELKNESMVKETLSFMNITDVYS